MESLIREVGEVVIPDRLIRVLLQDGFRLRIVAGILEAGFKAVQAARNDPGGPLPMCTVLLICLPSPANDSHIAVSGFEWPCGPA